MTEIKTVTFAVPNELHSLITDTCKRPGFSIGCSLPGTHIEQFSPLTDVEELDQKFDKLQKEKDNLQLELIQYKNRYENANRMQVAAQLQFAELVQQGVLKFTPNGYEPVLSREYIDETVFMCKIRANRMAEALHKYKYQKNNAYATDKDREDAETAYMSALQLFNESFVSL